MSEYTKKKISTFKDRFSELCDKSPMNDTAIADALNVSRQTVCSWKSGTRSPKKPTVISIANYFDVDTAWLMGFDVSPEPSIHSLVNNAVYAGMITAQPKTPEARAVSYGMDSLSQEQRELILNMVKAMFPETFKTKGTDDDEA